MGRSGLKTSRLCLGTMTLGSNAVDESASFEILDTAEELGFTFLDCANVYPVPRSSATWGKTEEVLGRWLRRSAGRRERMIVSTKFGDAMGPGPNQRGGSRKHVVEACEASLRRLDLDHIDLYWMHFPDPTCPIEETLAALDSLVRNGKILYIGAANYSAEQLADALKASNENHLERFVAVQPRWSLLNRLCERELVPLCQSGGVGVLPYNPLAGGLLSGKYSRTSPPPPGTRFAPANDLGETYRKRYWNDAAFDLIEALVDAAAAEGIEPAQLALVWLLSRPGLTAPIIGATKAKHLTDNSEALNRQVSSATLERLTQLSAGFA